MRTRLLEQTPSNLDYQRDIIRASSEIALSLRQLGETERARESLRSAMRLEDALGEPDSFTRNEFGDLEMKLGNRGKALEHYQAALLLAMKRIAARPQDMQARRELADTHEKLGAFYEASRQWEQAREWHSRSLAVWKDWTRFGVSSPYNLRREKKAADALARAAQKK